LLWFLAANLITLAAAAHIRAIKEGINNGFQTRCG
jgi:hypothetical protein